MKVDERRTGVHGKSIKAGGKSIGIDGISIEADGKITEVVVRSIKEEAKTIVLVWCTIVLASWKGIVVFDYLSALNSMLFICLYVGLEAPNTLLQYFFMSFESCTSPDVGL